jgi:hypothetical protein
MNKAATWSYIMGIWELVSIVVLMGTVLSMLPSLMSISTGASTGTIDLSSLTSFFNSFVLAIGVVLAVTIPVTIIFGYFMYKVGGQYGLGSAQVAGISSIIIGVGSPVALYGLYQFFNFLTTITSSLSPPSINTIMGALGSLIIGAGIVGIFSFIFLISFIIVANGMKNITGIDQFGSAMVLAIVGIFFSITFPIGVILFGSALKKAAVEEGKPKTAKPSAAQGATGAYASRGTTYCPYCGAKVEPDSLFCPSCGSSLKKEG